MTSATEKDEILAGTDLARIHRFSLLVAIAWGFFTLSHAIAGRYGMAMLHGAACVVSSIGVAFAHSNLAWRERIALPLVAGGSLVVLVAIAVLTGGSDAPAMGFVSLVPLVTGLFRHRAERLSWLVISLAAIGAIPILADRAPIDLTEPVTLAHRVVAAVGLAVLLYFWGSEWRASSDRQATLLDARARTIEAQAAEIERARDEALRASELKSRFVAMTSHELRGPLNGMLGMSHALEDSRLEDHQRELVRSLRTSAESLSRLLADLLDLSRIEAGHLDVVLAPTEIRDVLADVVDALAPAAAGKGLDIASIAQPNVPAVLDADAGRLAQVLRNLVSNAVKFTEHGEIVLEATRDGDALVMRVTDTGAGMREEDVSRIFAPFEQVSAHLVDRRAGTGLGLWIARNIVEGWGGTIEVDSALEKGTTFRVTMPIRRAESASPAPTSDQRVALVTRRPLTARAFESVGREIGVHVAIVSPDALLPSGTIVADVESLTPSELELVFAAGSRAILGAPANRIAECEALATRSGGRVLLLPVRASRLAQALERTSRPPARPRHDARLLVVDDDAINRRVARHAAEQLGLEVIEATSGEEALRIVKTSLVDVVLLDLHLEGASGDVIARSMREMLGERVPALVAYTGTVLESDRRRLRDAGLEDVLAKPLDRSAFDAAIGRALNAQRRRSRNTMRPVPPAFDDAALQELAKIMGGRDAMLSTLEEFLPELAARVATIGVAITSNDRARLETEAHRLASMAATFGAYRVATIAREIESGATKEPIDRLRERATDLAAAHVEVEPILRTQ